MFSLNWFKKKKRELEISEKEQQINSNKIQYELQAELTRMDLVGRRLQHELMTKQLTSDVPTYSQVEQKEDILENLKPYSKIKFVNNILSIVLQDGNILSKSNATIEDFKNARNAADENVLFDICSTPELVVEKRAIEKETKRIEAIQKGIQELDKLEDFEVKNDSVYLKGINRSLPQLLVEKFLEIVDSQRYFTGFGDIEDSLTNCEEYNSLKKFWMKCCLNPNAQSAEDLYDFLSTHQFKIDSHGNFYAYRRVVSKSSGDKKLSEFVSNTYTKIKAVWKKNPVDFCVFERLGDYKFCKNGTEPKCEDEFWKNCGNLKELYLDLPNIQSNSYTSSHTGNEDYRIGSVISMPRNEGNDDNSISCSKGFHAASKEYDYSSFGDTPILVIINPIDVLAVPKNETGKLRTCRWFFACTLDREEEHILDDEDFCVSDLGDVFEEICSKDLETYVQNSFAEEVKRHTFTIPNISTRDIQNIVSSLEEMENAISSRVKNV